MNMCRVLSMAFILAFVCYAAEPFYQAFVDFNAAVRSDPVLLDVFSVALLYLGSIATYYVLGPGHATGYFIIFLMITLLPNRNIPQRKKRFKFMVNR